jgi:hypothetical protein
MTDGLELVFCLKGRVFVVETCTEKCILDCRNVYWCDTRWQRVTVTTALPIDDETWETRERKTLSGNESIFETKVGVCERACANGLIR